MESINDFVSRLIAAGTPKPSDTNESAARWAFNDGLGDDFVEVRLGADSSLELATARKGEPFAAICTTESRSVPDFFDVVRGYLTERAEMYRGGF